MADSLVSRLKAVLPAGHAFGVYHLSTPPTRTDALYHAPPGKRPDKTYLESHFLAVTISPGAPKDQTQENSSEVIAFALEIFLFTTAFSTTLFVAKADSSGYLYLLNLPKGTPSPIRAVTSTFLTYLMEHRGRPGVQSVVSLFARAQSQYLFPGSVDNPGKHVLDDRGLVKWWCRVLDPLLGAAEASAAGKAEGEAKDTAGSAEAYLVVPGLDQYETRAFLPRRPSSAPSPHWTLGHPLERISHYTKNSSADIPPRCLIPRYPDDPKARYLDELDEEAERGNEKTADGSDKKQWNGRWTSVRSLDQFWEMMAFRQECSSGRLTGFIWVVYPVGETTKTEAVEKEERPKERRLKKHRKVLRGFIVSRRPRPKTQQRNALAARPASTPYYRWPPAGRGRLLVDEADYKRINELLLQLDFSTLDKGIASTRRWVQEAGVGSGGWRLDVLGEQSLPTPSMTATNGGVTDLSGLVKRKRAPSEAEKTDTATNGTSPGVNMLSTGLVRKKQKNVDNPEEKTAEAAPAVNVLNAGLVRKKPKA
ncbi:hypothetical protein SEUCBS139899_006632 [Sporothrix eucalyptigena]|uniref:histone acetyltransferase n=1 Tax=Sporothrix eucalyptigena TaxID=1812306 RepID=A0ABP0B2R8_9PEZI